MKKLNKDYKEPYPQSSVIKKLKVNEFSIGQPYDGIPANKIKCNICGSDKFIVGLGSYFTAIKCPICKWEMCIHDS